MAYYFSILLFGVLMGLIMSCGLIYVNKFKEYIEGIEHKKYCVKVLDITWKISLPIVFGLFLVLPIYLFDFCSNKSNLPENLISLYIGSFLLTVFILLFILIKLGKIKTVSGFVKKKGDLPQNVQQHKFVFWFVRIGSIGVVFIQLAAFYIKQNHAYLYQKGSLLPWIVDATTFIIVIIILWLLFNKKK